MEHVLEEEAVLLLEKIFKTRLVHATPHAAGGNPDTSQ